MQGCGWLQQRQRLHLVRQGIHARARRHSAAGEGLAPNITTDFVYVITAACVYCRQLLHCIIESGLALGNLFVKWVNPNDYQALPFTINI